MNYRVRFTEPGWLGRSGNDRVRRYMMYTTVRVVIQAIKTDYNYPANDYDYRRVEIDIFEDTAESRLVASKGSGRVNFSWYRG